MQAGNHQPECEIEFYLFSVLLFILRVQSRPLMFDEERKEIAARFHTKTTLASNHNSFIRERKQSLSCRKAMAGAVMRRQ